MPKPGQRVRVSYVAMVWDGATTTATEYAKVSSHEFTLGDRRTKVLHALPAAIAPHSYPDLLCRLHPTSATQPLGLHRALLKLQEGQSATIVLDPEAAYGEEGFKPHVPELAHVVYVVGLVLRNNPAVAAQTHKLTHNHRTHPQLPQVSAQAGGSVRQSQQQRRH